jgi:hypothetical protein
MLGGGVERDCDRGQCPSFVLLNFITLTVNRINAHKQLPTERVRMTPELFKILASAAIPLCGGVYATLLGFRLIGTKPGENIGVDDWHKQWGKVSSDRWSVSCRCRHNNSNSADDRHPLRV